MADDTQAAGAAQAAESNPAQAEPQPQAQTAQTDPAQGGGEGNPQAASAPTDQAQGLTDSLLESGAQAEPPQAEPPQADPASQKDDGAPEAYEAFEIDGETFKPEDVEGFASVAKELNLSQEKAQKMLAAMVPTARKYMVNDLSAKAAEWKAMAMQDPEIGGADFAAKQAVAVSAYKQFATPLLREILTASGLGNHPEVLRMFYRVGKTMQQDTGVAGSASAPGNGKRILYPKSNMVEDL